MLTGMTGAQLRVTAAVFVTTVAFVAYDVFPHLAIGTRNMVWVVVLVALHVLVLSAGWQSRGRWQYFACGLGFGFGFAYVASGLFIYYWLRGTGFAEAFSKVEEFIPMRGLMVLGAAILGFLGGLDSRRG